MYLHIFNHYIYTNERLTLILNIVAKLLFYLNLKTTRETPIVVILLYIGNQNKEANTYNRVKEEKEKDSNTNYTSPKRLGEVISR
jgi:hypothetical protein